MTRVDKRRELRERLEDAKLLTPTEHTDFNMDRWLDAYEEDVERCVVAVGEYVKNRRALGMDGGPVCLDEPFFTRPDMARYYGVFTQSEPTHTWVNSYDNGLVFVETGVSDAIKACKLIRAGEFLNSFFRACEYFLQLVLENERRTGRRSYGVCIFDMGQMAIAQYINPMAPINRIFEARVGILLDFYSEMLGQVVIVNPPRLLNVLLKIMRLLLPPKVISRFQIAVSPGDIEKWICPEAVPIAFGGKKVVHTADVPETGCNAPLPLGKEDYLRDGMIWERYGVKKVPYENCVLSVGETYVKELQARAGQTLLFEYFANRNFEIRLENEAGDYLLPRFRMCTPVLAEEGAVQIKADGLLRWELKNLSPWMRMKLRIALQLID